MYNETTGDENLGIPAETLFVKVDPAFVCPRCKTPKNMFIEVG
ncbi:MAG: rubredoxin [Methanospirillum sp.]|nr:rubredoxin [Methanospirillum sp.]